MKHLITIAKFLLLLALVALFLYFGRNADCPQCDEGICPEHLEQTIEDTVTEESADTTDNLSQPADSEIDSASFRDN